MIQLAGQGMIDLAPADEFEARLDHALRTLEVGGRAGEHV